LAPAGSTGGLTTSIGSSQGGLSFNEDGSITIPDPSASIDAKLREVK